MADLSPRSKHALPSMSAADASQLGSFGEYRLIEKLGEGGMGSVYKAWHIELERLVALKVLASHRMSDPDALARFRHEMKAVGRCDHPNIVRAHDAREVDGTYFLAMEYVDGFNLEELVARLGPLPAADACELIRRAAVGLRCAAEHGLVHRDIKPSNLMLSRDGELKILDLGLARLQAPQPAETMTVAGQVMGTPDYMAPEQATDSHAVDIRADIYSLGCTLYMLLAGEPPFGAKYHTAFEKIAAHLRERAPSIQQSRRDVPRQLADVLARMLAKTPEDRFASPGEVADAIGRFAVGADLPGLVERAGSGHQGMPDAKTTLSVARAGGARPTPGAGERPSWLAVTLRRRKSAVVIGAVLLVAAVGLGVSMLGRNSRLIPDNADVTAGTIRPRESADDERPLPTAETSGPDEKAVSATAALPAVLPGWIVTSWTRPRMGKPGLWLVNPNGHGHVPLTLDREVFDVQPCFSPDGRRVAFIRGRTPQSPNSVWVCGVDGSEPREVAASSGESDRFFSPLWGSDSHLYVTRDVHGGHAPSMELWQVELNGGSPRRVFGFQETAGCGASLATDISPDGRQLAIVAQMRGLSNTANVYLASLNGSPAHALWTDSSGGYKDARALWSPDAKSIAWCHYFSESTSGADAAYGVGLAQRGDDGHWTVRLQPDTGQQVTPLAWLPGGGYLLCAQIDPDNGLLPSATLFLMDDCFQTVRTLLQLNTTTWRSTPHNFGRLADWAIIPEDVSPHATVGRR